MRELVSPGQCHRHAVRVSSFVSEHDRPRKGPLEEEILQKVLLCRAAPF